ncbi:hypothetical protein [Lentzea flava]|uniref:Uncharacterized protein n=1 Tax=Lentzea flava TaxID=103732 RepID=A0ABQ2V745_9PSEU|nr:hypothetical protein [Lentzea flava]GGU67047.1 hypothetical protein GCM10010178_68550 [Lentzea flava]
MGAPAVCATAAPRESRQRQPRRRRRGIPNIGHADEDFAVAVGGNGHGARGSDEIGRLASTVVLGKPWDCPIPQDVFAPLAASPDADDRGERPDFLKPPFGLC